MNIGDLVGVAVGAAVLGSLGMAIRERRVTFSDRLAGGDMVPMVSKRGSFEAKIGMDHEECLAVLKCLRKGRESLVQEERLLVDGVMGSIKEELLGHLDDLREQVENLARVKESD